MSEPVDAAGMAELIARLGLVEEFTVKDALLELESKKGPAEPLLKLLERRSLLTPFQTSKLLKGDTDGYFIGGFRILYRIASGTFGKVYRGDDPRSGQIVAIKVLRRKWLEDENRTHRISQFEREGRIGLTLQHPNIVQILAVSKDASADSYFIVMEFVEGGNMRDILNIRKQMPLAESLRIMEECAAGLMHAYERGLTHRDIKPSNILLGTDGVAKLVDFGLAENNPLSSMTAPTGPPNSKAAKAAKAKKGKDKDEQPADRTLDYAGLERATGVKSGDIRSDIYFLGHCLFEMIVGKPLMERTKNPRAATEKRRFEMVEPTLEKLSDEASLPPQVRGLIAKAVALEPMRRFQTPEQFLNAIRDTRAALGLTGKAESQEADAETEAAALAEAARAAETQDDQPAPSDTPPPAQAPPLPTIIVVEKNAKLQEAFRDRFTKMGMKVLQTSDMIQAVKYYQKHPFELLLLDAGTVGNPSLEAFGKLLAAAGSASRPFVALLILNETDSVLAADYALDHRVRVLVRPVTMKHVTDAMEELLPELKAQADPARSE